MARGEYFVGREEELSRILGEAVTSGTPGGFFVVAGEAGSGKTRLLDELARTMKEGRGEVIRISCDRVPSTRPSDEAAEVRQFHSLMVAAVPPREADTPGAADQLDIAVGAIANSESSPGHVAGTQVGYGKAEGLKERGSKRQELSAPGDLGKSIENLAEKASALAKELIESPHGRRELMILVDDFDLLEGGPLGTWIMRMLEGLRGGTVVLTRQDPSRGGSEPLRPPGRARRVPLGNLSRGNVADYVRKRLADPVNPRVTQAVWEFTHGQPRALALVTDFIAQRADPEQAVRDVGRLGGLAGFAGKTEFENLVEGFFTAISDEQLRDHLRRLCVTPRFDKQLLRRVLDVDEGHAAALMNRIGSFSFVTESTGNGVDPFLAIAGYVRDVGQSHLGADHRATRRHEIHAIAAEYFHDVISTAVATMKEEGPWSQAWYRYEDARFQDLVKDWLYHVARLTGSNRQSARLHVARIFMEAFFWWGVYVPFSFCEDILDDWSRVVRAAADDTANPDESADLEAELDKEVGQALRDLYDEYPKYGQLEAAENRGKWVNVRRAVIFLRDAAGYQHAERQAGMARHLLSFLRGLGLRPPSQRDEMTQFRGLLAGYLAEASAYLDPADQDVDGLLASAIAGVDDYARVWMNYMRAEVALLRRRNDQVMSIARRAARASDADHEVTASLHRICADARWALGEHGLALDGFARAVAHAYACQADAKGGPDPYTFTFQQEMTNRCTKRLKDLHSNGDAKSQAVLRSACERIAAFFGPYWQESGVGRKPDVAGAVNRALAAGDESKAASLLFPALPDLTTRDYRYHAVCSAVTSHMAAELKRLPGHPLPAAGGLSG